MIEKLNGMHEIINFGQVSGVRLYHNKEAENYGKHWHTCVEVIMPVKHGYTVIVGDEVRELAEGDIAMINSGLIHSLEAPYSGERIILQFDSSLLYNLKDMETLLIMMKPLMYIPRDDSALYQMVREKLERIIQEYDSENLFRDAFIYAYIVELFAELGRGGYFRVEEEEKNPYARKQVNMEAVIEACAFINKHYMEKLTLEEVARVSGFSKYHFTRIFKQQMKMTYYDYLNAKRVKRAEELLGNYEMSVTDVAMNSGFSSLSSFNRTFKSVKGCAPSEYRKQKRD